MNIDRLKRFVAVVDERKEIEERDRQLIKQQKELETAILHDFEQEGVNSVKVEGVNVHIRRDLWAKAKGSPRDVVQALVACGMSEFVEQKFNTQSMSAWVREQERNELPIPPALQQVLEVSEVFSVRTRKGA